jgi:dipeptide/tripeptide permease
MTVPGGIPRCRTGGIKPCVSAFGADQFGAHQADRLPFFFMAFYFAINVGTKKIGTLEPLPPRARASAAPAL